MAPQQRKDRQWVLIAQDFEGEEHFRQAVVSELASAENIGHRLGGAIIATPLRRKTQSEFEGVDEYETFAWLFQHTFMPAVRDAPAPEPAEDTAQEATGDGSEG